MPLQGSLSIERMCELARVSRASFYRSFHKQEPVEEELEVRSTIQQIAIEHRRRYGYRRISAELRRRGMRVNHPYIRLQREFIYLAVILEQAFAGRKPGPGVVHHSDRGLQYASDEYVADNPGVD
jgi:transposase InsO family protein